MAWPISIFSYQVSHGDQESLGELISEKQFSNTPVCHKTDLIVSLGIERILSVNQKMVDILHTLKFGSIDCY